LSLNLKIRDVHETKWQGDGTTCERYQYTKDIVLKVYATKRKSPRTRRIVKVWVPAIEYTIVSFTLYWQDTQYPTEDKSKAKLKARTVADRILEKVGTNDDQNKSQEQTERRRAGDDKDKPE